MMMPKNEHRPRWWVKWFMNPFKHKRGKGTVIKRCTRMDVFPYNNFVLGKNSVIEDFATINNGVGDVTIGENTIIGIANVVIGPISIGNNVMFAQHVVLSGLNHGYEDVQMSPRKQEVSFRQIIVADDVWIGANSVVTAGVTIGRHAVVGAGSIVTKDVPEFSVVVGNPARVIKRYNAQKMLWEKV
ncbi:Acetyltransferase (isoleucine patch superfamily) [bacterium A37T11]|nr:Acetyltransferase (isoleucine patch superfamily) [bacterium A37T11]